MSLSYLKVGTITVNPVEIGFIYVLNRDVQLNFVKKKIVFVGINNIT